MAEVNLRHLPWRGGNKSKLQREASNLQGEGFSSIKSLIIPGYCSLACGLQFQNFIAQEKKI